jgi:FMN phosphatase YigB (HAD superfamily)
MKKVAFDLGNVIVGVTWEPFIQEWNRQGLQEKEDVTVFFHELQGLQDVGLTTINSSIKDRFGINGERLIRLRRAWDEALLPSDKMTSFMNEYKEKGYTVAILSNMGKEHSAVMHERFPEIFRDAILHLSFEVGARKPTKLYFQSFMIDHPEFKGAAFIDDRVENVTMADQYGLRGCSFDLSKFEKLRDIFQEHDLETLRRAIG